MSIKGIKNIIFDLGGVILNIDYNRTVKAFKEIGLDDFDKFFSQYNLNDFFMKLEKGQRTEEDFLKEMRRNISHKISNEAIIDAWNAILLDFPVSRINLLRNLSKNYRLFLLSNTNKIHLDAFNKILFTNHNEKSLDAFFEKAYYSHEIGMRKPDEEIFRYVLEQSCLTPHETLFFDDTSINIDAAEKVGIKTQLISKDYTIDDFFKNKLNGAIINFD